MKTFILAGTMAALAWAGYLLFLMPAPKPEVIAGDLSPSALVPVTLPETLSAKAEMGETAFNEKCASCHGANAAGVDGDGPPLVHIIYEPSHHGDEAFQRAAELGVRSHHWPFGNMPPVDGLTRADVAMIVTYIRELQRANGIE